MEKYKIILRAYEIGKLSFNENNFRRRLSAGDNSSVHIGTRHTDPGPGHIRAAEASSTVSINDRSDKNTKDVLPDWTVSRKKIYFLSNQMSLN